MSDQLPFSPLTYGELLARSERAAAMTVGSVHEWAKGPRRPDDLLAVQHAAECIAYQDALMARLSRRLPPESPSERLFNRVIAEAKAKAGIGARNV